MLYKGLEYCALRAEDLLATKHIYYKFNWENILVNISKKKKRFCEDSLTVENN